MNCMRRREFLCGTLSFCGGMLSSPIRAGLDPNRNITRLVPRYYDAYLDSVAAKVNELGSRCVDGFWFITDLHVNDNHCNSGKIIASLTARTPSIRKTLCGGDIPVAFSKRFPNPKTGVDRAVNCYRQLWIDPIETSGQLLYTAKGNHDFTIRCDAKSQDGFTYSAVEARDIVMGSEGCRGSAVVTNKSDPTACYYYFDNVAARIRYIVADTTDSIDLKRKYWGVVSGMGETQLHWLAEHALTGIREGWGVVVMHHIPLMGCVGRDEDYRFYAPFRELLEAYQNRGSCTVCGRTYDFVSAKGRILIDITGHHHAERQTFHNGILHVTEPCDAGYFDYATGSAPWCGNLPEKKSGTVMEQTFDAVQLDPANNLIYFTRIGGGQDRVIHLKPMKIKVGQSMRLEASHLEGRISWGDYDAERVLRRPDPKNRYNSVLEYFHTKVRVDPNGIVTGIEKGEAVVLAMDSSLKKEIFPVVVV